MGLLVIGSVENPRFHQRGPLHSSHRVAFWTHVSDACSDYLALEAPTMTAQPLPALTTGDPCILDRAPHAHLDRKAMAAALRVVLGLPRQRRGRGQGGVR